MTNSVLQWIGLNIMTLGNKDQGFSFVVNGTHIKKLKRDDIDLLGVNIDSKLTFNKHVSAVCGKVNKNWYVDRQGKDYITHSYNWRFDFAAISGTTAAHVVEISLNS